MTTLPSKEEAHVKRAFLLAIKKPREAVQGQPVTIQLDREVDVSADACSQSIPAQFLQTLEADILWMDDNALTDGKRTF